MLEQRWYYVQHYSLSFANIDILEYSYKEYDEIVFDKFCKYRPHQDSIKENRESQIQGLTSSNIEYTKENDKIGKGEETNSIDDDIGPQGWNQLRMWSQANPSLVQGYPQFHPNSSFINNKIRLKQDPFLDQYNNETYQIELQDSFYLKDQKSGNSVDNSNSRRNTQTEQKQGETKEEDCQFEEENQFSDEQRLPNQEVVNNFFNSTQNQNSQNDKTHLSIYRQQSNSKMPSGVPKRKRKPRSIKTDGISTVTIQQQYELISKHTKPKQLTYIQERISHYEELRSIVMRKQLKQKQNSQEGDMRAHQKLIRRRRRRTKSPKKQIQQLSINGILKGRDISIELLQQLDKKFQTYQEYKRRRYKYGDKITLAGIGEIYHLEYSMMNSLYNMWLVDPGFEQKLAGLKQEKNAMEALKPQKNKMTKPYQPPQPKIETYTNKLTQMRYAFCHYYMKLKKKDSRVYYLEEFPKQLIFGTEKVEAITEQNPIHFSLLALLGITGRASWKVMLWLGTKFQKTEDIEQLYKNVKEDEDSFEPSQNPKNYVILDSSLLKEQETVKRIQNVTHSKVLFLPQMSKQLNPLQLWFEDVRNKVKQTDRSLNALNRVLQLFSGTDFNKYIADSQKYAIMALQKHNF